MTIITVHILEALVVLLIGLKLIRIRSLYKDSLLAGYKKQAEPAKTRTTRKVSTPHKLAELNHKTSANLFLNTLPEPEVLFAPNHEEIVLTDTVDNENREEKSVLNAYIDDFFYESPKFSFNEKPMPFKESASEQPKEDEFITVQKENAEMVRALEALKREIGISAQY